MLTSEWGSFLSASHACHAVRGGWMEVGRLCIQPLFFLPGVSVLRMLVSVIPGWGRRVGTFASDSRTESRLFWVCFSGTLSFASFSKEG